MIDENKEELASLYALGLLSGAELAAFEAELNTNPELRALTQSLQSTAANLPLTAPAAEPSTQLKSRIFASIDKLTTTSPQPDKKTTSVIWIGWTLAAGLGIAASFFGALWIQTRGELRSEKARAELAIVDQHRLEQKLEESERKSARQIAALQRENGLDQLKIAKLAALSGNSPDALAIAVWNPSRQQGLLTVKDFPKIGEDQSYQLWVIDANHQKPVSGGVFSVDEQGRARLDFHPTESTAAATQFAISRERKGGVPEREGPIIAAGSL